AHGTVSDAHVVMDRESGQSTGVGFVEMSTDEEAQAAMDALDGQDFEGRNLRVNEARPREDRRGGGGGGGGGRGGGW
ncbi:MAG: RNA-binding protein, partial [Planctomycetota bacterium]